MKLTEKRCHEFISQSMTTIGNICDTMNDLQTRLAVVDLLTIRLLVDAEVNKINYYNDILVRVYDVPDYLEKIEYDKFMSLYEDIYLSTKAWMYELKEHKYG